MKGKKRFCFRLSSLSKSFKAERIDLEMLLTTKADHRAQASIRTTTRTRLTTSSQTYARVKLSRNKHSSSKDRINQLNLSGHLVI